MVMKVIENITAFMNPTRWAILAGAMLALLMGVWSVHNAGFNAGRAQAEAEAQAEANRTLVTQAERISNLIALNQEVQRDLNNVEAELASVLGTRAAGAGLRDKERAAIAAAARAGTAEAIGRYAAAAERDIAGVEADAETMGQRAVRAAAVAHALDATLRAQSMTREELRAQRENLRKD
jgi:hypothetical protein